MPLEIDLAELGLELDETKGSELKEKLSGLFQSALDKEVTGLKSKNGELIQSSKATKQELEALKSQFDGLDIESVKGLLQRASQDEETKLIAEGKLDEVISRRTERLRAELDKKLNTEVEGRAKAEKKAKSLEGRAISDAIKSGAIEAGAEKSALDDFVFRGQGFWQLDDEGNLVAMKDDEIVYGKDAKTPLTPKEWAESLRESAPHLFPRAQGGGALGGGNGKAVKPRSQMNPEEKRAYIQKHGQEAFLKLPKE